MTVRTCTVREHERKLRDRLNTEMHRKLASEIASLVAKRPVRVISLRTSIGRSA